MVKVKKDLVGYVFGNLTVVEQTEDKIEPSGKHRPQWLCQCSCGNKTVVVQSSLKSGNTKTCGHCKHLRVKPKEDLTGQVFTYLTVLEQTDDYIGGTGDIYSQWKCRCQCGKIVCVTGNRLKSHATRSCGCLAKERVQELGFANKKYNRYEEFSDYVISYTSKNEPFYVDIVDYEKIKNICWLKNENGYIISGNGDRLHRIVTGCPDDKLVDHIGGEATRNDNRKSNLRIATPSQNSQNSCLHSNNTSGYTGVTWDKKNCKWIAQIKFNYKNIFLGRYVDIDDAIRARRNAEEEYFGEWSYRNSQIIAKGGKYDGELKKTNS